jgi:hypothetical protein
MARRLPARDPKTGRFVKRPTKPLPPPLDPAFVARLGLVVVPLVAPSNILENLLGRKVIDGR